MQIKSISKQKKNLNCVLYRFVVLEPFVYIVFTDKHKIQIISSSINGACDFQIWYFKN